MSKIVWVVSGPSVVGKSYFIDKKTDRLSEVIGVPNELVHKVETFDPAGSFEDELNYLKENESVCLYHIDTLHMDGKDFRKYTFEDLFSVPFEKKVIILGIPYNEYKKRFESLSDSRNNDHLQLQNRYLIYKNYVDWVNKLKEHNIPYIFVEAKNEYKTLEEIEFFKMLRL